MVFKKLIISSSLVFLGLGCGSERQNHTAQSSQASVFEQSNETYTSSYIEKRISELNAEADIHKQNNNIPQSARVRLELNFFDDVKKIVEGDSENPDENLNSAKRKYKILSTVLSDKTKDWNEEQAPSFIPKGAKAATVNGKPAPEFPLAYHPLVKTEVERIFKDFGPLYINLTLDDKGNPKSEQVKVDIPWSGYWYPFSDRVLYADGTSALVKYDMLMKKKGRQSAVAKMEEDRNKNYNPYGWEGMCDAWSIAAVMSKEPQQAKTIAGINFTVADQKALLTFAHHKFTKVTYGIQYRGDVQTDGTYQDMMPEAFHKIVTHVIENEKRALVVDDDAGVEVWNKPLYRYLWSVKADPTYDFAFVIKASPWYVRHRSKETEELTSSKDILAPTYTYRLFVDKADVKDGKYRVIAGEWTDRSYETHPDTVTYPVPQGSLGSHNAEFEKNIDAFKTLFMNEG